MQSVGLENTPENGRKWISLTGKELGVEVTYSEGIKLKLFHCRTPGGFLKDVCGSATRQTHLSQKWSVPLESTTTTSECKALWGEPEEESFFSICAHM